MQALCDCVSVACFTLRMRVGATRQSKTTIFGSAHAQWRIRNSNTNPRCYSVGWYRAILKLAIIIFVTSVCA